MDCKRALALLDAYRDDALPQHEGAQVAHHLARCRACSALLEREELHAEALRASIAAEAAQLSAGFTARVMAEIAASEEVRERRAWLPAVWAACAAGALAVVGLFGLQHGRAPAEASFCEIEQLATAAAPTVVQRDDVTVILVDATVADAAEAL